MNGKKDISVLNLRVTIKQWNATQDAGAGSYYTLANSWTVWANKRNRTGNQFNSEAQQQWQYNTTFMVRYNEDFKSNFTVLHGTEHWNIDSIEIDSESYKGMMLLRCSHSDINIDVS
jgi:SPP1 family predicted phage head-tail adaptor